MRIDTVDEVGIFRLYLLRGMYLLIAVGLGTTIWPYILFPEDLVAGQGSVVRALLGALAAMCLLGLRYPLRMLPLLIFELLWKTIWVVASAIPMWLGPGLDTYASETLFATLMGVVLVPIVIPWGYVVKHYLQDSGARWRKRGTSGTPKEEAV